MKIELLPTVVRDAASAEPFDAAASGKLLVKRRATSGMVLPPEAKTDPSTGSSDLEYSVASGNGTLVSWTTVHRAPLPALAGSVPYISAVVELAEGPWLLVRLVVDESSELHAGAPVGVRFVRSGDSTGDGEVVPVFQVASATALK